MKMDYQKSVALAIALGYEGIHDESAYKGIYYSKNGMIWIHDIEALKASLGSISSEELVSLGYDVDAYNKYKNHTNEMADDEMKCLYSDLSPGEREPAYFMDGMYLFPDGSIREI
ncbi:MULTISPECIES: hypothetical protein [Pseudomonas]|nr:MULTISPECIES: hypothetical protein [Pseudomonas]MBO3770207.1 hypothetical protein [Pseudomonas aeruginosa]MBX5858800.1 hypothetical protein [Pseudomonas aeruginosa]MCD2811988.1 hypothetical protein [Pseudomonas aeruginosa]MCH0752647.1 hypothetical protein [Pseudomonas aeruginosa]MDH0679853.1 hypothetical protein [Pseudomonas mosselii]